MAGLLARIIPDGALVLFACEGSGKLASRGPDMLPGNCMFCGKPFRTWEMPGPVEIAPTHNRLIDSDVKPWR